MLHHQASYDGVFPQPRGMIGKATQGALPNDPEGQQTERMAMAVDDRGERADLEVTLMRRWQRP